MEAQYLLHYCTKRPSMVEFLGDQQELFLCVSTRPTGFLFSSILINMPSLCGYFSLQSATEAKNRIHSDAKSFCLFFPEKPPILSDPPQTVWSVDSPPLFCKNIRNASPLELDPDVTSFRRDFSPFLVNIGERKIVKRSRSVPKSIEAGKARVHKNRLNPKFRLSCEK
jgi:hypothetical protein